MPGSTDTQGKRGSRVNRNTRTCSTLTISNRRGGAEARKRPSQPHPPPAAVAASLSEQRHHRPSSLRVRKGHLLSLSLSLSLTHTHTGHRTHFMSRGTKLAPPSASSVASSVGGLAPPSNSACMSREPLGLHATDSSLPARARPPSTLRDSARARWLSLSLSLSPATGYYAVAG
jgi:hypothetical protein